MLRKTLLSALLIALTVPAYATDDKTRMILGAGIGAAVGTAIGSEIGDHNEALIGGVIGAAVGAKIASNDSHHDTTRYHRVSHAEQRDYRRVSYHNHDRYHHDNGRRGPPHCPPGWAKKGRCG